MGVKITIIGAGSAVFSLNLIKDICLTPNLQNSTVSFMDINPERLETAYLICKRYAGEIGMKLNLEKTADRREALRGSDFVINTALAADHGRLQDGWRIAKDLGYRFGGLHIMHDEAFWVNFYQLRLMESIVRDMMDICPKAWFVLVANPVQAGVTYLKRKYPQLNIVGMCHGYGGVYSLAHQLGLERAHISFEIPGVNHFVWLTKFFYKGKDAFPILDEWIGEKAPEFWKTCYTSCHEGPKPVELYKRLGAYPIGDTANPGGGSWGYWFHTDDETEKKWKEDPWQWYQWYFKGGSEHVEKMKRIARDPAAKMREEFPGDHSHEPIIPLIEALACDVERVVIVNIQNDREYVPGVPEDYEVEIPALVSRKGVQGIKTDGLPKQILAYLLRDRVAPVEMELAAFEKGDRSLLRSLIMMDPYTKSEKQASDLLETILALPYHEEMRKHYK
ncbi:MAG: hypothetical protein ACM3WV_07725 [Bacillota bacterium]